MSDICEVVLVNTPNGPVRINKSDYDASPEKYQLVDEKPVEPEQSKAADATIAVKGELAVVKEGTGAKSRWFVAHRDGSKLVDAAGVDNAGYGDEAAAWAAIMALPV